MTSPGMKKPAHYKGSLMNRVPGMRRCMPALVPGVAFPGGTPRHEARRTAVVRALPSFGYASPPPLPPQSRGSPLQGISRG